MKRISLALYLLAVSGIAVQAQTFDLHKKPDAKAAKNFVFPKYTEQKLKNGLKVFVIEDHEQPTITFQMQLEAGTTADGDKSGLAEMTANLLTKGAGNRNALEIAEAIDGIGANIFANAAGDLTTITASGLKKHMPLILEIYSQVITSPKFPIDEFDKLVPQMIASVRSEKARGSNVAQALARKALYGENHPYARNKTEATIKSVATDDIRNFYQRYYRPNNGSLAVVGDITAKEIIPMLEKAFSMWEADVVQKVTIPAPAAMPKGVYFVSRPGSVQSSMIITNLAVPYGNPDYEKVDLAASYLGSGFGGRLFRTLRETYSYTYTPFGFVTRTKYLNRTAFGAEVRSSVTDSAIIVTMREIENLAAAKPNEEDFRRIKSVKLGQYLMSFEDADFLASLLQNADYNGVPIQRVKDYPQRLNSYTSTDVQVAAQKYLDPDDSYIVIVGNPDIRQKLEKFGSVYEYDLDLKKAAPPVEKMNMDAGQLINHYINAIGGREKLNSINSLTTTSIVTINAGGPVLSGQYTMKQKAGGKGHSLLSTSMFKQEIWVNDGRAWKAESMPGAAAEVAPLAGTELQDALDETQFFGVAKLAERGKTEVVGKRAGEIILKVTPASGKEETYYFDAENYLLKRFEKNIDTPNGLAFLSEKYSDYRDVSGVRLPKIREVNASNLVFTFENSYQTNLPIEDSEFNPPASGK